MECNIGASFFSFVVALVAVVRVAIGYRAGHLAWRGGNVLDRDEDPERFGFWQGVWIAVAIVFAIVGTTSLDCL